MMNMLCPYVLSTKDETQWKYEYNAEGNIDNIDSIEITKKEMTRCRGEQCGAFNLSTKTCGNVARL